MGVQIEGRAVKKKHVVCARCSVQPGLLALLGILMMIFSSLPVSAGLNAMTNHELGELEGGHLLEMAISQDDFYDSVNTGMGESVTVVRFSSDIYLENYGEIGALKMGNYPRTVSELGDMASMDSDYTMVYGPQNRSNTRGNQEISATYGGSAGDNPYESTNSNREDRIHDRYSSSARTGNRITLGQYVNLSATRPWNYFGSTQCSDHPETQWDINWENLKMGFSEEYPMRIYGLVLRAEFSNWGESDQLLRRFALGSNCLYGYSSVRPLVSSGWMNAEMSKLSPEATDLTNMVCFQLQRDPILDQFWSLSSFQFNPDTSSQGSFRQFWFNTNMNQIQSGGDGTSINNIVGNFQDKNHGFFLMVDITDRRFSGWNVIAGVNEYRNWPPLEQDPDHYFENEFITWRLNSVD